VEAVESCWTRSSTECSRPQVMEEERGMGGRFVVLAKMESDLGIKLARCPESRQRRPGISPRLSRHADTQTRGEAGCLSGWPGWPLLTLHSDSGASANHGPRDSKPRNNYLRHLSLFNQRASTQLLTLILSGQFVCMRNCCLQARIASLQEGKEEDQEETNACARSCCRSSSSRHAICLLVGPFTLLGIHGRVRIVGSTISRGA
jgi:hypothetical protein